MKKTFSKFVMIGLLTFGVAGVAQAQHYNHGGYHHYEGHSGGYVRGAVAAAIVGSIIYNANQNRQVIYTQPSPIYYSNGYPVDPSWAVTYTQTYDPYCNCNVLVKQYQDRFGNYHPYP